MNHKLFYTLTLSVLGMIAFATSPVKAQTTANGPYYAWPSWDQILPSSTRFIVLLNWSSAAVLDRETGLVWEKSPSTSVSTWLGAQFKCNDLAVGNRMGWRLPTLQELASLVDRSVPFPGPTLPSGHPFGTAQSSRYWSATTASFNTDVAWFVRFDAGIVDTATKDVAGLLVWCVRGGQGVDPQ
jgi:hypothetical protein